MYCKKCGKEIPNDANYCSYCGANQGSNNYECVARVMGIMKTFINNHKTIAYIYAAWVILHLCLYVFSSKGWYYNTALFQIIVGLCIILYLNMERFYNPTNEFYPFGTSFSEVLKGNFDNFSIMKRIDVYDFSELFFYTIVFPLVIYGIVKIILHCFCYCKSWYEKKASPKP